MLFYSPHANFQVICSPTRFKRHPTTGDIIETVPGIWANFGKLGEEYSFVNPETGETQQGAHIVGHYFDTEEEAVAQGWDVETRELVERKILGVASKQPEIVRLVERDAHKAGRPWPTFDEADAETVVELANALGLVQEALVYERENLARPLVLEALGAEPEEQPAVDFKITGGSVEAKAVADDPGSQSGPAVSGRTITV